MQPFDAPPQQTSMSGLLVIGFRVSHDQLHENCSHQTVCMQVAKLAVDMEVALRAQTMAALDRTLAQAQVRSFNT